ncbi:sugar phosphate isomerase/epimerase family protein [Singulisphaera acidiphila]|uniref:Sugar phosphate isomerase/epimerase n=1 Tax=Singulisphaera acidiphila (strain ATCC BAA-1392 / DSM 18658 / VKM B-2454 / MOB10) TaxID=886293 RepID=L0DCI9_SINAD|nr:sugar phosphate isomerase/epimerase family protein [Singulisphaera acidiphila]AGA27094.1 sugar phosphate isomerase/epimerase [Singulisphaera acidiphila DSM 18658]
MAIRSAVTISLVPEARGGPFVFWDDLADACRKASELGFDAVEIFLPGPDEVDLVTLRTLLDGHGLALAAVGTGAGWVKHRLNLVHPESSVRSRARDFIRAIIDFAGRFHAPAIIGSMQGRSGVDGVDAPTAAGHLADALEELGEHAKNYGVPLVYEPLNRYETNMANTVEAGMAILRSLSTKNVVLLADLFHMNIEESDIAAAIRAGRGGIGHVHFVDSNRRPAGLGHIDFAPIVAALEEIEYQGYASAEAFPYPDPDSAAERTMQTFRQYFRNDEA